MKLLCCVDCGRCSDDGLPWSSSEDLPPSFFWVCWNCRETRMASGF